ncbi:hypothetical protein PL321_10065 [Caloramator sp. mosi_1]|nr:hypothetical protein [Caloramator sp. mosi_1]WDC83166.1 hypothetical protein PL321_10065 [Caloramator sp. mosi_1]
MLNSAFLPNHSLYGFNHVFSKLKFFVVDELHVYRGAFGSHMANIIRRLKEYANTIGQTLNIFLAQQL